MLARAHGAAEVVDGDLLAGVGGGGLAFDGLRCECEGSGGGDGDVGAVHAGAAVVRCAAPGVVVGEVLFQGGWGVEDGFWDEGGGGAFGVGGGGEGWEGEREEEEIGGRGVNLHCDC